MIYAVPLVIYSCYLQDCFKECPIDGIDGETEMQTSPTIPQQMPSDTDQQVSSWRDALCNFFFSAKDLVSRFSPVNFLALYIC